MPLPIVLRYDRDLDVELVKALDPLAADAPCRRLRRMNDLADVAALVATMRELLPDAERLSAYTPFECLAAMRDLGLFLGSIKRHGVEPMEALPEAESVLLTLGLRTDMVPRDTVHHYVAWNPTGPRARTYTDEPMEGCLISAARLSMPPLGDAVECCRRLVDLEPGDPEFPEVAFELAHALKAMERAIDAALEHVTPGFFARTLRPYFEDVRVAGERYLGPAAAHVPLSLIDLAVWASDHGTRAYEEFWRESQRYALPPWRALYILWEKGPSLISRLVGAFDGPLTPDLHASAEALCRALRSLVVFRGKHIGMARRAYDEPLRLYSLGSGGGSLDLLNQVLVLTRKNSDLTRRSLELCRAHQAASAARAAKAG